MTQEAKAENKKSLEKSVNKKKTRKKLPKQILTIIGVVALTVLIFGGFKLYKVYTAGQFTNGAMESAEGKKLDYLVEEDPNGTNTEDIMYADFNEDEVITTMHKMTHQKVVSSKKWGAVEMTSARVNQLYIIVENSDFENKEGLLYILQKWQNKDFNLVDDDHNYLWKLHGGNVGEATGVFTEEEEKEFVERVF